MKPRFNEYDPRVLERVRSDEDFAAAAARASGGRPTYCNNRYYRAVANGGQGTIRPGELPKRFNIDSDDESFSFLNHLAGCE